MAGVRRLHGRNPSLRLRSPRPQWIPAPPIHYHLGVDGISMFLVLLTAFLTPISVLASWHSIQNRVKEFFVMLLLLEVGVVGVFLSLDLFLFFLFWELMLIPMAFLIGIWGHERRVYAAVKFVLYTMAGWWRDVIQESVVKGNHTPVVKLHLRYGMLLFIASEVMFFVAWFWAYFNTAIFHNDVGVSAWPPEPRCATSRYRW